VPGALRHDIDELNAFLYEHVNDGVYRAGFATSQRVYEQAARRLFDALDQLDARLRDRRYLFGPRFVETDWRLFVTLVRFDASTMGTSNATSGASWTTPTSSATSKTSIKTDGIRGHGQLRPHQAPLLHHPRRHQPTRIRADRAGPDAARAHGRERLGDKENG